MCGIAGTHGEFDRRSIETMLDRLAHRGPDGRGIHRDGITTHGHVRLALLDLSKASAQPFLRQGSSLCYNGELWNYRALRSELQTLGESFSTSGDTEVLSAALNRWGLDALPKLDGMFAFAWTDAAGTTLLARDSFGKIPLYVARTAKGFVWASERKAFEQWLRPISVPPGYWFSPNTGRFQKWFFLPPKEPFGTKQLRDCLHKGVVERLEADAPVCCLASGGLDSTAIIAAAIYAGKEVTAFTAYHSSDSEDLKAARRMAAEFGIRLIEVRTECGEKQLQQAIRAIEIPSKAQIEIAVLCLPLAQAIRAEGFKACLSGEAADELFGGYGNFCIAASQCSDDESIELRKRQVEKMARGNFVRCNKIFMAAGVECRLPFMEKTLAEQCVQMTKTESPPGKKFLKAAIAELVPKWVLRRNKETFQGAGGISAAVAKLTASPVRFFNCEVRRQFGYLPSD